MLPTRSLPILLSAFWFTASARAEDQPIRILVTVEGQKDTAPPNLTKDDVMVFGDNQRMRVTDWTPIDRIGLQLWLLIDDGTDTSLGTQLDDLRKFVLEQPVTTQIGIGYLRNGTVEALQQPTADHAAAAKAIRLPIAQAGISASPYLSLIDLIKKWPSGERAREVVMITSGIDPEYGPGPADPYLDQAIDVAQRAGVVVHSIYYGGAGHFGHSYWRINWGQNNLAKLSEETGGEFFWQGNFNPVSLEPYFKELNQHFAYQHVLTFLAQRKTGFQKLKLKTEDTHVMLLAPSRVYVPGGK
jgi:hypothetical protein